MINKRHEIFFIFLGDTCLLIPNVRRWWLIRTIETRGKRALGEILEARQTTDGDNDVARYKIRFDTEEGVEVIQKVTEPDWLTMRVGERLNVYYDPNRPRHFLLHPDERTRRGSSLVYRIIIATALGSFAVAYFVQSDTLAERA